MDSHAPPRTLRVTLLMVTVFLLGGWQLWQGVLYWRQFGILKPYGPTVNLQILGVVAFLWGSVFVLTAVVHYIRLAPVARWLPMLLLLFFIYHNAITFAFRQKEHSLAGWLTFVFTAIVVPTLAWWLLKPLPQPGSAQSKFDPEPNTQA